MLGWELFRGATGATALAAGLLGGEACWRATCVQGLRSRFRFGLGCAGRAWSEEALQCTSWVGVEGLGWGDHFVTGNWERRIGGRDEGRCGHDSDDQTADYEERSKFDASENMLGREDMFAESRMTIKLALLNNLFSGLFD